MKRSSLPATALLIAVLLVIVCSTGGITSAKAAGTFTVGGTFALTGPGAAYGSAMSRGLSLGVEGINAAGGAGGVTLQTQFLDMKGEPKDAVLTANRLIAGKVQWISTHLTSPPLAQCPVAERAKVVLMNGAGNSPELRRACSFLLNNVMLIDDEQRILFKWAVENLHIKKAGILRGLSYSEGAAKTARQAFKTLGVVVVAEQSHPFGASDLKPQLEAILHNQPDAIYLLNDASDELLAIRQAHELGYRGILLSAYNLLEEIAALPSEQTAQLYSPGPPFTPDPKLVQAYTAKYGGTVTFFTANFYNQALILSKALDWLKGKNMTFTGTHIRDAILTIKTFPSVSGGSISFSNDGTMLYPLDVFQVKNGKWTSVGHISLDDVQKIVGSRK